MKTIGKISLILTAVFFVSVIISVIAGPAQLFSGFESASVNQFDKISSSGVQELDVNLLDTKLNIHPIKGEDFEFNLTGSYAKNKYNNSIELSAEKLGSTINVHINYPERLVLINRHLNLEIGVPESYRGELRINVASGNIYAENLSTSEFEITGASGNIVVNNIENAGDSSIKTASGNINVQEFKSESLAFRSISGNINCRDIQSANNFNSETTSGNIEVMYLSSEYSDFKSVSGEILVKDSNKINSVTTTSGDVEIRNSEIRNGLNIKTISGGVSLNPSDGTSVNLIFETVSGKINNDYGDINGGTDKIFVKTTSGDLTIY